MNFISVTWWVHCFVWVKVTHEVHVGGGEPLKEQQHEEDDDVDDDDDDDEAYLSAPHSDDSEETFEKIQPPDGLCDLPGVDISIRIKFHAVDGTL